MAYVRLLAVILSMLPFSARSGELFSSTFAPGCTPVEDDIDGDRLVDCLEYLGTIYGGTTNPRTNPFEKDTDGDGLFDGDEVLGTTAGLSLAQFGVSPLHQDMLVEIDWINDGNHTHSPTTAEIQALRDMFAAATIANPDGSTGIKLIIDHGQGGVFTGGNLVTGHPANLIGVMAAGSTYQAVKTLHFSQLRDSFFRYGLMAHSYNGGNSSGAGGRDEFIVTMGTSHLTYPFYFRSTIAHELGHTIGLHHGGFESCNGKPNYNSVMNYRFTLSGVDSDFGIGSCDIWPEPHGQEILAFSDGIRRPLNQQSLNEFLGMCTHVVKPVDWNNNSYLESSVAKDLIDSTHATEGCSNSIVVLQDHDDWEGVNLAGSFHWVWAGPAPPAVTTCPDMPPVGSIRPRVGLRRQM